MKLPGLRRRLKRKLSRAATHLRTRIARGDRVKGVSHRRPDPDALASMLAMQVIALMLGATDAQIFAAGVPSPLARQLGINFKPLSVFHSEPGDTVILTDAGSTSDVHVSNGATLPPAEITFDHHEDPADGMGVVEPRAGSTSAIMLTLMFELFGPEQTYHILAENRQLATALAMGALTDASLVSDGSHVNPKLRPHPVAVDCLNFLGGLVDRRLLAELDKEEQHPEYVDLVRSARPIEHPLRGGGTLVTHLFEEGISDPSLVARAAQRLHHPGKITCFGGVFSGAAKRFLKVSIRADEVPGLAKKIAEIGFNGGGRKDSSGAVLWLTDGESSDEARQLFESGVSLLIA